jgi:hypothetical protein
MEEAPNGPARLKALALARGVPVSKVIAQSTDADPFYCGTDGHVAMGEWFAALWERFGYTSGVHLRRIHYQLVTREPPLPRADGAPYINTNACWKHLCAAGRHARNLGLLAPESFEDRRNPPPRIYMAPDSEEEGIGWEAWPDPVEWYLPTIEAKLVEKLDEGLAEPYLSPTGYEYRSTLQPYHVEVWVEKSTMEDILVPLCERHATNLVTGVGDMSITAVVSLLERVKALGKPARILYISDYDPKGVGMPVGVARKIEFWRQRYAPGADIRLEPIILAAKQVAHYTNPVLPRSPIKESDKGKAGFEALHGAGAVELDALEATHPGEFARIVSEHIVGFRDGSLARKVRATYRQARETLDTALQDAASEHLNELEEIKAEAAGILRRYQPRLQELGEELEAELAPLRVRLSEASRGTQEALETLEPEMPELPEPETSPRDDGWLFDSRRDYLEQIDHYKAR